MKTVINIDTYNEIEVPEDYIECSVCGRFHPFSSYCKENETKRSRTNCYDCYIMDLDNMVELQNFVKARIKSKQYQDATSRLYERQLAFGSSFSVAELIEHLQTLNPSDRVLITESGYYSQSEYADIHVPEFKKEFKGVKYYSIGHSDQNY